MNLKMEILEGKITSLIHKEGYAYTSNSTVFYTSQIMDMENLEKNEIKEICKRFHGVAIEESEQYIRIYNDPFCSHPVYIGLNGLNGTLVLSTQFVDMYQIGSYLNLDYCGFYELLWMGQMLYDRTIFRNVRQLPAASFCEIDRNTMSYRIETYYDFEIFENKNINSQQNAEDMVYQYLRKIFSKYENMDVLMALSGGLDSRLSACLLSENTNAKRTKFFTFGYDKHILEYTFAKKVAKKLGLALPIFIKLDQKDYKKAKELAIRTGCQVGLNHGHTYQCLRRKEFNECDVFVSNYYSDAVMGWDAKKEKKYERIENLELYRMICTNKDKLPKKIAENVVAEALNDLKKIVRRYNIDSNFSCFEEFFYVTERNTKFHLRSAYQCNDIMRTEIPFAEFDLLKMCISIPLKYRWEKKLEKNIIRKNYFQEKDISSRRYYERSDDQEQAYSIREKIYYKCNFLAFKVLSYLNIILALLSNNKVQVVNPYHTENQRIIFERYFKDEFLQSLERLAELGVVNAETYSELKKNKLRGSDIGLKFTIIGLRKCIEKSA